MAAHHHDGHVEAAGVQLVDGGPAIQHGHSHVQEDEVKRSAISDPFKGFRTVPRRLDLVPRPTQDGDDHLPDEVVVVDDEDARDGGPANRCW